MIAIRHAHPVLRRREFFLGRAVAGSEAKDIVWLKPDGTEMTSEEWHHQFARSLGVYVSGQTMTETDERGRLLKDDDFIILFNAHHEELPFVIPRIGSPDKWRVLIDSSVPENGEWTAYESGSNYPLRGRSLAMLIRPRRRSPAA